MQFVGDRVTPHLKSTKEFAIFKVIFLSLDIAAFLGLEGSRGARASEVSRTDAIMPSMLKKNFLSPFLICYKTGLDPAQRLIMADLKYCCQTKMMTRLC